VEKKDYVVPSAGVAYTIPGEDVGKTLFRDENLLRKKPVKR